MEKPENLTAVARLYYLDGLGQTEIAALYGVSRSTVSRMLTTAREQGLVRIFVDEYDPRDRALEDALVERFGLKRAVVIRGAMRGGAPNRRAVGYFAASEVATWIVEVPRVGLTGGRTLGEIVRSIAHRTSGTGPQIIQLMGTVAASPTANEGSELSRALASRLNGTFYTLNAPAFVKDDQTRRMFLAQEQIRAVWRLIGGVRRAFVGVGSVDDSMVIEHGVLPTGELASLRREGAVAEICGRFVDRLGNEIDLPTRSRVVSIDLGALRKIEDVVAVTSGTGRGEAVETVLRSGIATSLVTDEACARAILATHTGAR